MWKLNFRSDDDGEGQPRWYIWKFCVKCHSSFVSSNAYLIKKQHIGRIAFSGPRIFFFYKWMHSEEVILCGTVFCEHGMSKNQHRSEGADQRMLR